MNFARTGKPWVKWLAKHHLISLIVEWRVTETDIRESCWYTSAMPLPPWHDTSWGQRTRERAPWLPACDFCPGLHLLPMTDRQTDRYSVLCQRQTPRVFYQSTQLRGLKMTVMLQRAGEWVSEWMDGWLVVIWPTLGWVPVEMPMPDSTPKPPGHRIYLLISVKGRQGVTSDPDRIAALEGLKWISETESSTAVSVSLSCFVLT